MRAHRYPLIVGAALVAVLVGAQAAQAANVKAENGYGYARFFDTGPRPTLQACDSEPDGAGIVAFVFDNADFDFDGKNFKPLADAGVRGGDGKCGPVNQIDVVVDEYIVIACRHDRSEDENGYTGWNDRDIELGTCGQRVFD